MEDNPGRVNDTDRMNYTPLILAALRGNMSLFMWLVDEKGADVNITRADGMSAL